MKKMMRLLNLLTVLSVLFAGVYPANALILPARSLVLNPAAGGLPSWYQDINGVAVQPCLDATFCGLTFGPGIPLNGTFNGTFPLTFSVNFPGEFFYYSAQSTPFNLGLNGDTADVLMALEAVFLDPAGNLVGPDVAGATPSTFQRLRVTISPPKNGLFTEGVYTATGPWGTSTFDTVVEKCVPQNNKGCQMTRDIPKGAIPPVNFDTALGAAGFTAPNESLSTFLRQQTGAPAGFLGDGGAVNPAGVTVPPALVTVTGPPGTGSTDLWTITGKVVGLDVAPAGAQNFGAWKVGATSTPAKTFTVTNLTGVATGATLVTAPAGFTLAANGCNGAGLAAGNSCSFDIAFAPTANGIVSGNVTIAAAGAPTAIIPVTGIGDSLAPTVTLVPVIPFTRLPSQVISGTVADNTGGAGVASVQVSSNGIGGAIQTIIPSGGTWTANVSLNPNAATNITVTATDSAQPVGNLSGSQTATIINDTVAPTGVAITVTSPTKLTTQTITGTATDANGISSVSVSLNGTLQGTATVTGGTWSFNVTGMTLNADNTITATATDSAGNSSLPASTTITVDTGVNPFTLTAVTSPTKTATQLIGGTIEAGSTVTVAVNGGVAQQATVTGTTWSFLVSLAKEGNNTIIVSATDSVGNTATQPTATIVLDTQVIPFTLTAVTPLTKAATQAISGTVEAGSSVTVNGQPATVTGTTWNFTVALTAPDGNKSIVVSATDTLGNTATLPAASITLDTTPPALTLTAVTTPTKAATQAISGTVEAGASVTVNGQPATVTGTTWSFNVSLTAPDGSKSITVIATDAATNAKTVTSSITLDTTAPALTLTAVTTPTRVATQTITGTVEAGATVTVNGQPATVTGTTWSFNVTGLAEGANNITVTATDPAGNPASQQSNIKIVLPDGKITGAPTVAIADALMALRFAVGLAQPTPDQKLHADVAPLINGKPSPNGKVDIGDVVVVLRKVVDPTIF